MAAAAQRLVTKVVSTSTRLFENSKPYARLWWKYARVEMAPPKVAEIPQAQERFFHILNSAKTGAWRQLTVRDVGMNTIIGIEIAMWFFVGECIGKRSLLGYQIPGILNNHLELVTKVDKPAADH